MPPVAALTATAIPVCSAIVAMLFAARLGGAALARPAGHRIAWALGFALFAGGSAAEAYGASYGWSEVAFRLYYLLGGVLAVALLGLGSAWLHLPRSWALVLTGAVAACVPAAAITVLAASVDQSALGVAHLRPPPNDALKGLAFLWAVFLNSAGTLLLVGGSVRSLVKRVRVTSNALILAGVVAVALSGTMTRVGSYADVYVAQLLGLMLIFAGVELAGRPRGARVPAGATSVAAS
jgi:hypothetical protein